MIVVIIFGILSLMMIVYSLCVIAKQADERMEYMDYVTTTTTTTYKQGYPEDDSTWTQLKLDFGYNICYYQCSYGDNVHNDYFRTVQ